MGKPRIVNVRKNFDLNDAECPGGAVEFIGENLKKIGVGRKFAVKTELLCEETIAMFAEHASEEAQLKVRINRFFGDVSVNLSMHGKEFSPLEGAFDPELDDSVSQNAIRAVLLRSHGEKFKYRYKAGVNHACIQTGETEQKNRNYTVIAMFLGLALGLILKLLLPQSVGLAISQYLLVPIKTIFMNALKIVIAPVVFLSIATCFSQFDGLSDFGKLGAKVLGMYLLTTFIAVLLSIGVFFVLRPGQFGFAADKTDKTEQSAEGSAEYGGEDDYADETVQETVNYSLIDTIINIVPSNFFHPFIEANTLQLILLAVLCGIAVGTVGQYSSALKGMFEALNSLFLAITVMISKCIPFAVFASVALMIFELGGGSVLSLAAVAGTQTAAVTLMLCVYALLILLLARLSPIKFFKKNREGMLTSFTLSSSSAAMPTNIRVATEKLGVSPRVANFSIPLGATINMDGTCIFLVTIGLFLARAYGVEVSAVQLISTAFTIILLSLGAPGVPGAGLVCLGIVLKQLGVPVEAMGLVIAIAPFLDMLDTMNNTTGDMACAVIVAKSESLLDKKAYNG